MTSARDSGLAHVLFVDDDERTSPSDLERVLRPFDIEVRLRHPEEVFSSDLSWASLVIVDYFLADWSDRDDVDSVARAPMDGLAVAATMRSTLLPPLDQRTPGAYPDRPVAFALWSGHLSEASFRLPDVVLTHVFSRENNLEWAFRRDTIYLPEGAAQVAALATAVTSLPPSWPQRRSQAEKQLWDLLDLDLRLPWAAEAQTEVLRCRPPLHELSERSHGMALIRWLLHRILPYPTFLLDEQRLCSRLRIDSLGEETNVSRSLREVLAPYEYRGALRAFLGRRWWRVGVEHWLFEVTGGDAGDSAAVAAIATGYGGTRSRDWLSPVTVISADLSTADELVEVEETVRVRPDDWPPYADDAFARRVEAEEDPELRALVDPADRILLTEETEAPGEPTI